MPQTSPLPVFGIIILAFIIFIVIFSAIEGMASMECLIEQREVHRCNEDGWNSQHCKIVQKQALISTCNQGNSND